MTAQITGNGFQYDSFNTILAILEAGYQAIYGNDIDLTQNTPDGQRVGIEAKVRSDLFELLALAIQQFDPDLSIGQFLNMISKYAGLERKPATKSLVDVNITSTRAQTLPAEYTLVDLNNNKWQITTDTTITAGTSLITFEAVEWGSISANAGDVNAQDTVALGVTSVNNPTVSINGVNEETDEDFRYRRSQSTENPSYSTIGCLIAKLGQLSGVTDLIVHENTSVSYDPTYLLNSHSMWIIIEGGSTSDIAKTIAMYKTEGAGLKGAIAATWVEPVGLPYISTYQHFVRFDRPIDVPLYIRLVARQITGTIPVDVVGIQNGLLAYNTYTAQAIQAGRLYQYANLDNVTAVISNIEISNDGIAWTEDELTPFFNERWQISIANITII